MCDKQLTRRKRFTLKKLIDFAVSKLCPGGKPGEIQTWKGRPEVVVELPCCESESDLTTAPPKV